MTERVDNSILTTVWSCDTQTILEYILHLTTEEIGVAAEAGKAGHRVLADWFRGYSVEDALANGLKDYIPISEKHVEADEAADWRNVRNILRRWMEIRQGKKWPFVVEVERIEQGVKVPLADGIEFFALIDMPTIDTNINARMPLDHKFRVGSYITDWWKAKFKLSSQFSGYAWAEWTHTSEVVSGCYINAVELTKLPSGSRKCATHKVPYDECRMEHAGKHDSLIITHRNPEVIGTWYREAVVAAQKFIWMKQVYADRSMLPAAQVQGQFNGSCTFCQWKGFCVAGRPLSMLDTFKHKKWAPWDGVR